MVNIILADAYLHVLMHPLAFQFLHFTFERCLTRWMFTRTLDAVLTHFRLLHAQNTRQMSSDLQGLISILTSLGWKIHPTKSEVEPDQDFVYLGMRFQTLLNRVSLSETQVASIQDTM